MTEDIQSSREQQSEGGHDQPEAGHFWGNNFEQQLLLLMFTACRGFCAQQTYVQYILVVEALFVTISLTEERADTYRHKEILSRSPYSSPLIQLVLSS